MVSKRSVKHPLPLMKIGNDYITTESAVEKWITDNIGQELFY
jgi:hypothetical protein